MAHLHILGICGTFMAGVAALAKAQGHHITGCDQGVYPPMSLQLQALGITLINGYHPDQLELNPDLFIIGNVVTRGNPLMEAILDQGLAYCSGPEWLSKNVLYNKHVLAVAGTHGKTTTSSMLAWILEKNGLNPGFLIGGMTKNFEASARWTDSPYFVIEADEYDTAFFDKRSKFVHYHPRTVILNNLEFDHADIFDNLTAIETQFHHLVRVVPSSGRLIVNGTQPALIRVLERGCWSDVEYFGSDKDWQLVENDDDTLLNIVAPDGGSAHIQWQVIGRHNRCNAVAAVAAACHVGVPFRKALEALTTFEGVKRRLEMRGKIQGRTVYDDFAHHPTAIQATLHALRKRIGSARMIVLFEPRSNTMKRGVMREQLPTSFVDADNVYCYANGIQWDVSAQFEQAPVPTKIYNDIEQMASDVVQNSRIGDHIVVMSNGSFGGIIPMLLTGLSHTAE